MPRVLPLNGKQVVALADHSLILPWLPCSAIRKMVPKLQPQPRASARCEKELEWKRQPFDRYGNESGGYRTIHHFGQDGSPVLSVNSCEGYEGHAV